MTKSRTRSPPPAAGCTWSSSDRPQAISLRVVRTAPAQVMTAAQAANTRPRCQQPHARLAGLGEPVGGHAGQAGGPGTQRGDAGQERFGDVQVQQQPGDGDDLAAEQRAEPGPGHPEHGSRDDYGTQDREVPVAGQDTGVPR